MSSLAASQPTLAEARISKLTRDDTRGHAGNVHSIEGSELTANWAPSISVI